MKAKLIKEAGGYDLYRIDEDGKRVTFASTQDYKQKLSLKNCQAIERGYDLDAIIENNTNEYITTNIRKFNYGFEKGFQKALEILGDKKFSEEDITKAYNQGEEDCYKSGAVSEKRNKYIQSLQQIDWDVEVEMEYYDPLPPTRQTALRPKRDADGCLILKRV